MSKKIDKARLGEDRNISHVRFENSDKFTPVRLAIPMAERGEIENIHVVKRCGKKYLRSNPDDRRDNNLLALAKK